MNAHGEFEGGKLFHQGQNHAINSYFDILGRLHNVQLQNNFPDHKLQTIFLSLFMCDYEKMLVMATSTRFLYADCTARDKDVNVETIKNFKMIFKVFQIIFFKH